ncbi:MAG: efflux transporter periplasmic adaptor subunit [Polaromonas sp. 39-63-203]|jgi:RND family efflux transporter MFP subunit|uniref:efflux RND transporter periplasmic adaptor subunit n=1 Tax=Polaromonas sp. TaxID=1869339 RepID=UPI000BDB1E2A|nr:efflux RND transporter periplasmic adaptor subunit [Polaromonas sp.]OYY52486.1 MAG: efflux transporter periplasmic adaptor subunit [Polaromonas sp. 35-63-240]OYY99202.1 MAG: efflux transporter periplasmic adaptor subunit [Polaromonas sp. 28-63-22]OYZ84483.1 MAG: efflux transporter periplasmic adaptor subunit [Polaromonas sp. 24-62-144]OZA98239.1 MAG: efflux transporter periplasmic adaptor subunit [Polaromonas sp. 39-63-203]HQS31825.1 efflux RND transporter periplasmic adaptor subunit [Polar
MKRTALALLGVVTFLVACSRAAPPADPVRAVKVITVGSGAYQSRLEFAGEVKARVESRLGFRVGGKIIRRQAEAGQRVKAGQVLAELDPQDYRLAADAARAQVAAAQTSRDLASADFRRYQELKNQNFISGAELDRRETTLKSAEAQLQQARSQLAVQANQASYASLVADVSGVVTAVEAEPGQVVAAGAPVVRIAADGPRDVIFAVPEDRLSGIVPGEPVRIRVWAQNRETTGKVREIAASSDPQTRTYAVKASVDAGEALALGSTVYVTPEMAALAGSQVIKLPTTALRQEGNATAVWVLDKASMTVNSQVIQVATADGNDVVVASGLKPGALVVSAGVHVLSPGQKVSIYQPAVVATGASPAQTPPYAERPAAAPASAAASR